MNRPPNIKQFQILAKFQKSNGLVPFGGDWSMDGSSTQLKSPPKSMREHENEEMSASNLGKNLGSYAYT